MVFDISPSNQRILPVAPIEMVKPEDLYQQMQSGTAPIIVDLRLPTEWMGLRIGNVLEVIDFGGGKPHIAGNQFGTDFLRVAMSAKQRPPNEDHTPLPRMARPRVTSPLSTARARGATKSGWSSPGVNSWAPKSATS
jgi:hypothetical protein